ncbi:MAG: Brp/Blh family beta-carotene 15,15'-dioxygenase [Bacteroidota bacterium]
MQNAIKLTSYAPKTDLTSLLMRDYVASCAALFFFLVQTISPELLNWLSIPFLAIGFIFPGMTHGSLDFYIVSRYTSPNKPRFTSLAVYLLIVAIVVLTWTITPKLVFILFLLNSAYHFGETDLRSSSSPSRILDLVYGTLLLSILFITHSKETVEYLHGFGISVPNPDVSQRTFLSITLFSLIGIFQLFTPGHNRIIDALIVLAIGINLPLILAFGIYYILVHSRTAWKDLGQELALNQRSMLKLAAPFTAGGCLLITIIYFAFDSYADFFSEPVSLVVIGLAAITLPHSIAMSLFYHKADRKH